MDLGDPCITLIAAASKVYLMDSLKFIEDVTFEDWFVGRVKQ